MKQDFTTLEGYHGGHHPIFCLNDSTNAAFSLQSNPKGICQLTAVCVTPAPSIGAPTEPNGLSSLKWMRELCFFMLSKSWSELITHYKLVVYEHNLQETGLDESWWVAHPKICATWIKWSMQNTSVRQENTEKYSYCPFESQDLLGRTNMLKARSDYLWVHSSEKGLLCTLANALVRRTVNKIVFRKGTIAFSVPSDMRLLCMWLHFVLYSCLRQNVIERALFWVDDAL